MNRPQAIPVFRTIAFGLLAGLVLALPAAGAPAPGEFCPPGLTAPVYMQIVLDRSGSMELDRAASGRTRCEDSILEIRARAKAFLGACPAGSRVSVMTFFSDPNDNVVLDVLIDFSSNEQAVLASLASAPPCDGGTPLADAMCAGAGRLNAAAQLSPERRYFLTITDGGENRSVGACSGLPTSDPLPPYSPGSWHAKVFAAARTTTALFSFYNFGLIFRAPGGESPSDPPISGHLSLVADTNFFQALADETGGILQRVSDEGPRADPLFGLFSSDFESGTTEDWSALVPGPDFTWSPQAPALGEFVTFTDQSADPSGPWLWRFPGGFPDTSTEQNPQVQFFLPGEKAVSLTTSPASNRRQKVIVIE